MHRKAWIGGQQIIRQKSGSRKPVVPADEGGKQPGFSPIDWCAVHTNTDNTIWDMSWHWNEILCAFMEKREVTAP
jgi:hypothetical protein